MPTQTFPFTTPGNYTYDTDDIEITGGKALLKLQTNPGNDFQETFDNDTGFTYDSDKTEFSGGQVQQKDQRPANATFYASYTSDINGNWGNGTLTGSAIGGASVSGGKLDLAHNDNRYVDYDADGNADSQQTGCIRFKVTINYATWPPAGKAFFVIGKQNGSLWNLIQLQHKSSGQLSLALYDQAGVVIYDSDLGVWSPTQGNEYEIEFNWDITTGATRLFIDGIQHGSTITDTGTRDSDINLLRIGSSYNAGYDSDFYIDDFLIFSTVQHTTDYTPDWSDICETIYCETEVVLPEMEYTGAGTLIAVTAFTTSFSGSPRLTLEIGRSGDELYWNGSVWTVSNETYAQATDPATFATNATSLPVNGEIYGQFKIYFTDSNTQSSFADLLITLTAQIYPIDNPTVEIISRWYLDDLEAFTETASKTGSDEIKYILKQGSTWYWFNAGTLEESDGTYSQANTVAEIETYKADFTDAKVYFAVKLFLHSNDGITTPEIDTLSIQYSYAGDAPDTIDTCLVWGTKLDFRGNPDTDTFYIQAINSFVKYKTSTVLEQNTIQVTPDSSGYWEAELIENENMTGNQGYAFIWNKYNTQYKLVPDEETKEFNSLEDWDEEG